MKRLIAVLGITSVLFASTIGGALAVPIKAIDPVSGSFSGSSPSGTGIFAQPAKGDQFPLYSDGSIDYFGFYIPFQGSYSITASVQATNFDSVSLSSFQLYDAQADLLPGTPFAAAMYTTVVPGKYLALDPIMLAAGLYYLGVDATGTNQTPPSGYAGTLSKTLSTVPLPASAPMFGAALLVLGAVGYGVKRKKDTVAV